MVQRIKDCIPTSSPPPSGGEGGGGIPEDTKYSLILHGLCRKYVISSPLERHVFSIIENMSRHGALCLYKTDKFVEYSGGTASEVETVLSNFEERGLIEKGKLKTTPGWKLTKEVRRSADFLKDKIDRLGKDPKTKRTFT